jgi:hypothetical protein
MDTPPFDRFARVLTGFFGRRTVAQGLFGLSLVALANGTEPGVTDVDAKKNKKKKRKKKRRRTSASPIALARPVARTGVAGTAVPAPELKRAWREPAPTSAMSARRAAHSMT